MTAPLASRGTAHCMKCQRKLSSADRVIPAYIVEKTGVDPSDVRRFGAWLSGEFELIHVDCDNPSLDKMIVISG